MAWGTPAGKRVQKIDKQRHLVLQSVHPSPLSASRGFFDCGHFKKANEWLVSRYGAEGEIDWALVPSNTTLATPLAPKEAKAVEHKATATEKKPGKENVDFDGEIGTDDEAALDEALTAAEEQQKSK
jgi:uracil-DNA glycosylase